MNAIDQFYDALEEPQKGCLLAVRAIVLKQDKNIIPAWKYGMPFFCYKNRMFCYLWQHKTFLKPYIGIVEGKYFDESFSHTGKKIAYEDNVT